MLEDMRRYVEAGLGSLSPSRARDMARSLLQGQGSDQVNRLAGNLMEWSRRSRERITELVQTEVRRQLRAAGVATRDDLDALRKRVRDLEKAPAAASPPARSGGAPRRTATKSTARKSTAKKPSARKPSARKSTARKSTARKSTARRSSSGTVSPSGSGASSGSRSGGSDGSGPSS